MNFGELLGIEAWKVKEVPETSGSGKFGKPCLRTQAAYASAPFSFPLRDELAGVVIVFFVGPTWATFAPEEPLVMLVDRLDRQVGLVPSQMEVVLAIDLLGEHLRLAPVFVEVPVQRLQR